MPSTPENPKSLEDKVSKVTANIPEDDQDLKEVAIERLKWANRRTIAWVFSYAAITFGFLIFMAIVVGTKEISERVTHSTDLLTWIFMGYLSIPALYFGGTVLDKFSGTAKKTV